MLNYRLSLKVTELAALTFLTMALSLSTANLPAQEPRKVISNPAPPYPEMAKQFHLEGSVKVQAVIAADGRIKSTRVIGGHPVLVDAVKEALKKWRYAPASGESTTILEFDFHP
jgi:TonB family protein